MSQKAKQSKSFMYGAIILLIANALVKIIGAVFKIPLTYILNEDGMGYFSTSYQMYTWMFILATAGLPVAISKMVSEGHAKSRDYEVNRIFLVSMRLLLVIGAVGCAVLYFGADFFAENLLKNSGAASGIRAIAPAMIFVSAMSAYRGYFQGLQNMLPTACSEVAEALGKLVIGFSAAYLLASQGMEKASAGAVFGVSCGAAMGFVILFVIYQRKKVRVSGVQMSHDCPSDGAILKKLVKIAIPITIGASVFSLTSLIDMAMIMRRLQAGGFSEDAANRLWGSYSGYAFPLFNLPPTLINAITISIVPAIASAFVQHEHDIAANTTCKSMKITILFALPCSVGMSMLSSPILDLIYNKTNATATLQILALGIIFVSLVLVTNAILQATGNVNAPVKNMVVGGVAKIVINYLLVAHPDINIKGAPIGTTVCYIIILTLNIIDMKKKMQIRFPASELVIKPAVSVAAMSAVLWVTTPYFADKGKLLAAAAPIAIGAVVYTVVLIAIRGIDEDDIALLPKAEKLTSICRKLKIIR